MFAKTVATVFVSLAVSVPASAGNAPAGDTRDNRVAAARNSEVFRAVQRTVLRYPHFTIFDSVHAQVEDGLVVLTGKVTMPYKQEEIARRVRQTRGVREVENRIGVLPVSGFDDALRVQIARAIYSHSVFRGFASRVNPPVHVIVENGHVTLEGVVQSEVERAVARSIARSFLAFDVRSDLKTESEARAEVASL